MMDIVIPNNNEEEFIAIAHKLGYKTLYFLYNYETYQGKKKNFADIPGIKIVNGILADGKNLKKIKNKMEEESVFVAAKSSDKDMEIMEGSLANLIFSFEENQRRDFMHQRASGLNHILCSLARKNDVAIGFSFSSILNAKNTHEILGRIMQNLRMCRQFKVKTAIASFAKNPYEIRSMHDLKSLFKILEA
ncbi:MAG: RNase P subunit p30 family protein [Nanoarchaeota archaeon]